MSSVLDLSTLFENEENKKEIYEAINKFFDVEKTEYKEDGSIKKHYIQVDGKTDLTKKDVINITALEIIAVAFKQHFEYDPLILKVLIERYKVNSISKERKGRTEFVDILKGMFRQEMSDEKKRDNNSINKLLGRP